MIKINKGLNIPITGEPSRTVDPGPLVRQVALVGDDYVGLKPTMAVQEGDSVRLGQLLFTDKTTPGVRYNSPGCGRVAAIRRGPKRKLESVVIELEGDDEETFRSFESGEIAELDRETVRDNLVASGLWTSLRARPFSRVPPPDSVACSIFVTAIDTNPLAAEPAPLIRERRQDFASGLRVLTRLTDGPVFLCKAVGADVTGDDIERVTVAEFAGPHPAGLTGTHIHFLDPVSPAKTVWHLNYQDVMAIGSLFLTGRICVDRVIALAGPAVEEPRLVRTRLGASTDDITRGQLQMGAVRVLSGSVLSGRKAVGGFAFLGRYHLQISAIGERRERTFFGWVAPGLDRFSIKRVYASAFLGRDRKFPFTASAEGSRRAIVPIGMYETVMPLDIIATPLLKALAVGDADRAQALGCLELDEEDLALCSFVCPGKNDYGPLLRDVLARIEKEG